MTSAVFRTSRGGCLDFSSDSGSGRRPQTLHRKNGGQPSLEFRIVLAKRGSGFVRGGRPLTALRFSRRTKGAGASAASACPGRAQVPSTLFEPSRSLPSPPERAAEAAQPPAPASHISVHHGSPPAAPRPQVLHRDRAAWDRFLVVRAVISPRDPPPAYTPMPLLAHVLPAMRGGHNGLLAPLPFGGRRKW